MKRLDARIVIGVLLVAGGLLALAQAMGYLENATDVFFGVIFLLAGLGFLSLLFPNNWTLLAASFSLALWHWLFGMCI